MHNRNTTGVEGDFQNFLFPFHNFHSEFHIEFRQETLSTFSVLVLRFRSWPRSLNTFMPIPAHTHHGEKKGANQAGHDKYRDSPTSSFSLPTNGRGVADNQRRSRQLHFFCILLLWLIQEASVPRYHWPTYKWVKFHDATDPLHPYHPTGRLGWATEPTSAVTDIQRLPSGFKLWIRNRNRDQSWLWALLDAILRGNAETKEVT